MTQPKTRKPRRTYTDEFKNQLVQLYLNGKRKSDIVREYDISPYLLLISMVLVLFGEKVSTPDGQIKQSSSIGSFKEKDNRSEEENELIQFRKKIKQLEVENDILYPKGAR